MIHPTHWRRTAVSSSNSARTHAFAPHEGLDLRQASDRNLVLRNASLQAVHEELLTRYRVPRLEDSQQMVPLLRLIQLHLIEQPEALCTVFLMAGGKCRRRDYTDDRVQPFQGPQYATQNGQRSARIRAMPKWRRAVPYGADVLSRHRRPE